MALEVKWSPEATEDLEAIAESKKQERRLGLLFARTRILDYGLDPDVVHRLLSP
ncbi:hypothetical protein [Nitrosomonas communis]|uniref:hypothetical protein n=1 Tax=Nitrosomonas communis TaxID=44574 RepID=UPI0026F27D88|nr:hypothetical protein [Nitrosomonas communis]MCO6428947.1 hypothetical protein [Nitrosomonas communis]